MFRLVLYLSFIINVVARESLASYRPGDKYQDVNTCEGLVRGYVVQEEDYQYLAFKGIPYAVPPLGDMRFKPPLPLGPWNNVYIADRKVKCPQNGEGDEDCLVLNVFTPLEIHNGPLPVVVHIHGGFFVKGSAQTEGIGPLMEENVIVVTVNYRLGALGFLCLGVKDAPGNVGLKDQVAALKWVNRNIGQFGGDPKKVTLYGVDAGAASVEYHVLSHMSTGLFQQAIIESGAATPVWALDHQPVETIKNLAAALDVPRRTKMKPGTYFRRLSQYFMKVPARLLTQINMEHNNSYTDGRIGFAPCIERQLTGRDSFIINNPPSHTLTRGLYKKVPLMLIYATSEGLFLRSSEYYNQNWKEKMSKNFTDFLPFDLEFDTPEIKKQVSDNIWAFYFGNNDMLEDENVLAYLSYFGDLYIVHPMINSASFHSGGNNPVYLMEFAYKGNLGSYDNFYSQLHLAGHGDASKYVLLDRMPTNADDKQMVNVMAKLLGNFVKYGDPTSNSPNLLPLEWPTVKPNNVSYLRFDKEFEVYEEPLWGRKVFWDQLYGMFRKQAYPIDPGF